MLTIFFTYFIYSADCFVCIQSASNSSQVGLNDEKCKINGCKIFLSQGGFVIITSALFKSELFKDNASLIGMFGLFGAISNAETQSSNSDKC